MSPLRADGILNGFATDSVRVPLFNRRDLTYWLVPLGDNSHWRVLDGVIDYDAHSEAPNGKHYLWIARELSRASGEKLELAETPAGITGFTVTFARAVRRAAWHVTATRTAWSVHHDARFGRDQFFSVPV